MMRRLAVAIRGGAGSIGTGLTVLARMPPEPPVFVAAGALGANSAAAMSVPAPAGVEAGDVLLLVLHANDVYTFTLGEGGWTELPGLSKTTGGFPSTVGPRVLWKRSAGAQAAVGVTRTSGNAGAGQYGRMSAWRGCRASLDPVEAWGSLAAGVNPSRGPSLVTLGRARTVVGVFTSKSSGLTSPAPWVTHYTGASSFGNDGAQMMVSAPQADAGATAQPERSGIHHATTLVLVP